MNQEPDKGLEQYIDERLRALPEPQAPANLIPNVMRAIAARQARVWWRCAWPEWPPAMQVASMAVFAALLFACWHFGHAISTPAGEMAARMTGGMSGLRPIWTVASSLVEAAQVVAASIKPVYFIMAGAVAAAAYLAAVGVGSVCYRLGTGKNLIS